MVEDDRLKMSLNFLINTVALLLAVICGGRHTGNRHTGERHWQSLSTGDSARVGAQSRTLE